MRSLISARFGRRSCRASSVERRTMLCRWSLVQTTHGGRSMSRADCVRSRCASDAVRFATGRVVSAVWPATASGTVSVPFARTFSPPTSCQRHTLQFMWGMLVFSACGCARSIWEQAAAPRIDGHACAVRLFTSDTHAMCCW